MHKKLSLAIPMIVLGLSGCAHAPVGQMAFPEGVVQHAVFAHDTEWKPCPTHLPPGCAVTVLEGNPKGDDLFTVRFRLDEGFVMPPHTHPKDERVTVLKGKVRVAFGREGSHDTAKEFGPGDYYVNARGAVHTVWADETSIVQITGIGPWEVNFIDDPGGASR